MSPCLKQSLKEIALHQWDKWTKCSFIQAVTSLIYLIAFVNTQGRSYEDEHEQITVIIIKSQHPADLFAKHQSAVMWRLRYYEQIIKHGFFDNHQVNNIQ